MKVSRLFIKLIKVATCLVLVLAVLIPTVTTIYRKVINGGGRVANDYFSLDCVSVKMDHFYARSVSQTVISCIEEYTKAHTLFSFKTEELYKRLKDRCSVIKEFDCRLRVPKSVEVRVVGVQPYCLINNTYILGDKSCLFSRDLFTDFNINALPKITINQCLTSNLSDPLCKFLHKISPKCWQDFAITYDSESRIELVPKNARCSCLIVVNEDTFFDDDKIKSIDNVYDDIIKRGFLSPKTLHLTFDLRFDQRVVVGCKDAFNKRGTGL